MMKQFGISLISLALLWPLLSMKANADGLTPRAAAAKMFLRLAGVPIIPGDARLDKMEELIAAGQPMEAAKIATADPRFLSVTVRTFAGPMSSRTESPYAVMNDFIAMVVGVTRDDKDARLLLTGNFTYKDPLQAPPSRTSNQHYQQLEYADLSNPNRLAYSEPQWPLDADMFVDNAGLLSSRAWGEAHYNAGTNRRAVEYTFKEFLCTPITNWRAPGLPERFIRQDVDRAPGKEPRTFQTVCRNCHGPMDGMGGAFARWDYVNETLTYYKTNIAPKYTQHPEVFRDGYDTQDDYWINYATQNHNEAFGWPEQREGFGLRALGTMVANSKGFGRCMAKRAFKEVCRREPVGDELPAIEAMREEFEGNGYKLKTLFQKAALVPSCLGIN